MDDYFNPTVIVILLILLSVTLNALSNFKMSFELLNDNVILEDIKAAHQTSVERLLYARDRIGVTITHATIILSTLIILLILLLARDYMINLYYTVGVTFLLGTVLLSLLLYVIPALAVKASKTSFILYNIRLVNFFVFLLYPLTWILTRIKPDDGVNMSSEGDEKSISLEELSEAVEIVSKSSSPNDRKILTGLGWFVDAKVDEIMTHRTDMVACDINRTFEEIKETFISSRYSRIPIYENDIDNIVGVMFVKDIIEHLGNPDFDWKSLMRKPIFINDEAFAKDLLLQFQERKEHLAIVVDEYGSTQGVVTIEDIIEEIVGEIDDESDDEEENEYHLQEDGSYIFEGKISVNDFEHILGIESDELEDIVGEAETLAGLFIEISQSFPRVGASVEAVGYRLTVVALNKNRITKLKVVKTDES